MPSGKVHHTLWKHYWFAPVMFSIGSLFVTLRTENWITLCIPLGVMLGYGLGNYIDPDLDLVGVTSAEGRALKIPVIGIFFVGYWTIYGAIFRKHHRSFWTHGYIVSTAIRFVYQFWWIALFTTLPKWILVSLFGLFLGLCISDGVHIYADNRFGGR